MRRPLPPLRSNLQRPMSRRHPQCLPLPMPRPRPTSPHPPRRHSRPYPLPHPMTRMRPMSRQHRRLRSTPLRPMTRMRPMSRQHRRLHSRPHPLPHPMTRTRPMSRQHRRLRSIPLRPMIPLRPPTHRSRSLRRTTRPEPWHRRSRSWRAWRRTGEGHRERQGGEACAWTEIPAWRAPRQRVRARNRGSRCLPLMTPDGLTRRRRVALLPMDLEMVQSPAVACTALVAATIAALAFSAVSCSSDDPAGPFCQSGSCTASCVAALVDCNGAGNNIDTSEDHCGGCGIACGWGMGCVSGFCVFQCRLGTTSSGKLCVDVMTTAITADLARTCDRRNDARGQLGGLHGRFAERPRQPQRVQGLADAIHRLVRRHVGPDRHLFRRRPVGWIRLQRLVLPGGPG